MCAQREYQRIYEFLRIKCKIKRNKKDSDVLKKIMPIIEKKYSDVLKSFLDEQLQKEIKHIKKTLFSIEEHNTET